MCEIVAFFSSSKLMSATTLTRVTSSLYPSGSAENDLWVSPNYCVGLGHVSPSRADSVPDQPIPNENGRIQLIASGQFHDAELLRRKLESCGHQFQTQSDSEIVVHLYEQYG